MMLGATQGEPRAAMGRAAVFFDRDGVLTELVFNPATGERESPHALGETRLCEGAAAALRQIQPAFELFIVSNQPSFAKGKVGLDTLRAIAALVDDQFRAAGVHFREAFYCFHHPEGIVAGYSGVCACRKPSPHVLREAAQQYDLDLRRSWMVGDRESDIACGREAGCQTILIDSSGSPQGLSADGPDYVACNVAAAVAIIAAQTGPELQASVRSAISGDGG
jgi:D-glycero-D-manno-heptose 1,7-bisphosphate phosphatase